MSMVRVLPLACDSRVATCSSTALSCRNSIASIAACETSPPPSTAASSNAGKARGVAHSLQGAKGEDAKLPVAALRRLQHGRQCPGIAPIGQRQDQQAPPLGRRLGQLGQQGVGHFRPGQFHRRAHGRGGQGVVRTADGFRATGECRPSRGRGSRPEATPRGAAAAPASDREGGRRSPATAAPWPWADKPRHSGEALRRRRAGWRPTRRAARPPGPWRPRGADVAQGACGRLGRVGVGSSEQSGQRIDGLGVAPDAETADHAQPRPALGPCPGRPAGPRPPRDRGWSPGRSGPCARAFRRPAARPARGPIPSWPRGRVDGRRRTFLPRRARAEHGEQLGLLSERGGGGGGQQGDGQDETSMAYST